jgi:hypothetical protein
MKLLDVFCLLRHSFTPDVGTNLTHPPRFYTTVARHAFNIILFIS